MTRWLLVFALMSGCHRKAPGPGPEAELKDHASYSLGYQLGTTLKSQNVSVDPEVYASGLRDALKGTPARVSEKELQTAVLELRGKAMAAQKTKLREQAERNRADGAAFLAANKQRDGVNVLPSGLQYRVLKDGKGNRTKEGGSVLVNYRSSFIDGKELASSFKQGKPLTVDLRRVIPGWREALRMMKEGSKWELVIPPELAYGHRGSTGIGPDSTLVFEVELLRANSGPAQALR